MAPDRVAYLKYLLFCDHMFMHLCGCNQNAMDRSCCWDHYKDTVETSEYPQHFTKAQQRYFSFKSRRDESKKLAEITGDTYVDDNVIEWTELWSEYYAKRFLQIPVEEPQLELRMSDVWYDSADEIDYNEQQSNDS